MPAWSDDQSLRHTLRLDGRFPFRIPVSLLHLFRAQEADRFVVDHKLIERCLTRRSPIVAIYIKDRLTRILFDALHVAERQHEALQVLFKSNRYPKSKREVRGQLEGRNITRKTVVDQREQKPPDLAERLGRDILRQIVQRMPVLSLLVRIEMPHKIGIDN